MTEKPNLKGAKPESQSHSPEGTPPPGAAAKRSRRKKILVPAVLTAIGMAVILFGLWMYPRRVEVVTPVSAQLQVSGSSNYVNSHMEQIDYTVEQVRPDVTLLYVQVLLDVLGIDNEVPRGSSVTISYSGAGGGPGTGGLGTGAPVLRCYPQCQYGGGFVYVNPYFSRSGTTAGAATASIYLAANSLGVAANGATASIAFPEIVFYGTRPALLNLDYLEPSVDSYDWSSSYPASWLTSSGGGWSEAVVPAVSAALSGPGVTNGRVAIGINHSAQQQDSNFTLAAGILFGIGGGALIGAVQEALRD